MADINKTDIKLMQSQRLDDTNQGGGQMTAFPVLSGEINNLFPDISRFDRVYGRVSIRKAYAAVQTQGRETYYGSHTILTEQAADPNVSICFFSSYDWFDIREDARKRMEAYLVKGPRFSMNLWGDHYQGTSQLAFFTENGWPTPEIGDVLVLQHNAEEVEQFVRIIGISLEAREFYDSVNNSNYLKTVIYVTVGTRLENDMPGTEVTRSVSYVSTSPAITQTYSTVAADASRYYGVAILQEDVFTNDLTIRVDDINTNIVPSAASETAIVDATVGSSGSPSVQTNPNKELRVTRSLTFNIGPNKQLHLGEGILRQTLSYMVNGYPLTDDGRGNIIYQDSTIGSIDYLTGVINFGSTIATIGAGTGVVTYTPACSVVRISETGAIQIEINNRGFVYTFNCQPLPEPKTLKIDFLSGGKWYSLWDDGRGKLISSDPSIGSGSINYISGSVSLTLGYMPDIGSMILFFWNKPAEFYDLSGETLGARFHFYTNHTGIARDTFQMFWTGDGLSTNPGGSYCIMDINRALFIAEYDGGLDRLVPNPAKKVGNIRYSTGEIIVTFTPTSGAPTPLASESFLLRYNYGEPFVDTFPAPPREPAAGADWNIGNIILQLTNTPIVPNTFKIEWHTDLIEYEPETRIIMNIDPTFIFDDDGSGKFDGDDNDGTTSWRQGTVDYTTGRVVFHPDRNGTFPRAVYDWKVTAWLHPGVEESFLFDHVEYLPAASLFPTNGTVVCTYCTTDGANLAEYTLDISPKYVVQEQKEITIVSGGLHLQAKEVGTGSNLEILDGGDGKLYTSTDASEGVRVQVGSINYITKEFTITSDSIKLDEIKVTFCTGTADIDPAMAMVFRAPGSPIRPGSATFKATTGEGRLIQGTTDFNGNILGSGITGSVNTTTGLCTVLFGEWVVDDAEAQAASWYSATASDGSGNVWRPFSVQASSVTMNCVITSYLPLDADLLGLDPVRLPLDGKVPVFRDGYVVAIHHTDTEILSDNPVQTNVPYYVGRHPVDLLEVYDSADDPDAGQQYSDDFPEYVPDAGNYTVNLAEGTVTFLDTFVTAPYRQPFRILHRIEDMALASDVQVTGHISITTPLTHDYQGIQSNPNNPTLISSVLPSADLQSRAYNEFEQTAWTNVWSDVVIGSKPLASFNFVDYPITVINKPSIKERWLILFTGPTTISVIGENFGYMAENVTINSSGLGLWQAGQSGSFLVDGVPSLIIASNQFFGEYYWKVPLAGFGVGWQSGNCIRFNQDAANFPLWFIRTTLQAPATEAVDHYTIQIRGDSS